MLLLVLPRTPVTRAPQEDQRISPELENRRSSQGVLRDFVGGFDGRQQSRFLHTCAVHRYDDMGTETAAARGRRVPHPLSAARHHHCLSHHSPPGAKTPAVERTLKLILTVCMKQPIGRVCGPILVRIRPVIFSV